MALAVIVLGAVLGSLFALMMAAAVVAAYLGVIRPWQVRWGATDDEATRPMPGDDILGPSGGTTTRAITIRAPAEQVWPWLAQFGYGKAGWYSYDWLDNDGQRSAEQIRPQWQHLRPGDQILMMPGSGFDVVSVEDGHCFVARAPDGLDHVLTVLVSDTPEAAELRQNSPFTGILSEEERRRVLDSFREHWRSEHIHDA